MLGALMGLTWRAGAWIVGAIGVVAYVIYVKSQDAIIDIFQEDIQEWLAEFKKLFKEE